LVNIYEIKLKVQTKRGRYAAFKDNFQVKKIILGDGESWRRYILFNNPMEAK